MSILINSRLNTFAGRLSILLVLAVIFLLSISYLLLYPDSELPSPTNYNFIRPTFTGFNLHPTHAYPLPLSSSLDDRLHALRNAPGVDWEPSNFVKWNIETCGPGKFMPNHNKDLTAKAALLWSTMNSTELIEQRESMARYLEKRRREGAFSDVSVARGGTGLIGEGRGIVFTAGNADTLSRVIITLKLLRKYYGCTLPAAIYHFPSERPPPDSPLVEELQQLGAKLIEATGREKDTKRNKNYHLKAQAIAESEWKEVIYLDSDNLPTSDPSILFDSPSYNKLGALFFPDYWKTSPANPIWHILGVQCRDEWEMEAGQIIIDKGRHLDALLLSEWILKDWEFWFNFSDGDKDVFRFAFLALRKRWALPGRYVGSAALPSGTLSGEFCSHTMQQYDSQGMPMFVHYNLLKQIPSGVGRGFSWGRTKQVEDSPSTLSSSWPPNKPSYPDLEKGDLKGPTEVEADMLANVDDEGWGIMPASPEVRRRGLLERGIRPYFHGGVVSALCIDIRWEDPISLLHSELMNDLEIDFSRSPLEVVQWSDYDVLRDLERIVYDEGFVPSGPGF